MFGALKGFLGKIGDSSASYLSENKSFLPLAGGTLLAGLAGRWAEQGAWKQEKEWLKKVEGMTLSSKDAAKGFEQSLGAVRNRRVPNLPNRTRRTGNQGSLAAMAKAGGVSSQQGMRTFSAMQESIGNSAARAARYQRALTGTREQMIAKNIVSLGKTKTDAAVQSANYLRTQSESAKLSAQRTGDAWRQAISGVTKMAAAVMSGGTSLAGSAMLIKDVEEYLNKDAEGEPTDG